MYAKMRWRCMVLCRRGKNISLRCCFPPPAWADAGAEDFERDERGRTGAGDSRERSGAADENFPASEEKPLSAWCGIEGQAGSCGDRGGDTGGASPAGVEADVISALVNLGYDGRAAEDAVGEAKRTAGTANLKNCCAWRCSH